MFKPEVPPFDGLQADSVPPSRGLRCDNRTVGFHELTGLRRQVQTHFDVKELLLEFRVRRNLRSGECRKDCLAVFFDQIAIRLVLLHSAVSKPLNSRSIASVSLLFVRIIFPILPCSSTMLSAMRTCKSLMEPRLL